jgi:hypothetical protein
MEVTGVVLQSNWRLVGELANEVATTDVVLA